MFDDVLSVVVYLVVIVGALVCHVSGYDKSFAPQQNGKRQEGCLHKSLDNIPTNLICSQVATEKEKSIN